MKILKNKSGFSLIEILIAIGLMGALSAWMMNIFSQQTRNEKTTATNLDIDAIGQEIRNILADGGSCAKNFKGVNPNLAGAVNEIQKVLSDGTIQKRYLANEKKVGNSGVIISGYDLKTDETYLIPNGQKVGETVLLVTYDRGKMVQGAKIKSFKIPLSLILDDAGNILSCNSLASTTNLASICTSLGRSVNTNGKKCNPPAIYIKGDMPIHQKQYQHCEGGTGSSEHVLDTWTSEGTGTVRLSWMGMANDTQVIWRVYKNNDILSTASANGISSDAKTQDVEVKKGDTFKHTALLSGGVDDDCVSGGAFSVELDLLNML
ncbi:MAG: type II secretion system protein [Bacteriovorax sp.]|nr:type II secretion system protein [Bacteriovorax sp.]